MVRNLAGEPNRGEEHERGEEQHHQAQAVDPEGEIDVPIAVYRKRRHHLITTARTAFETAPKQEDRAKRDPGRPKRGPSRGCAEEDRERGADWKQDNKEQNHRKTVK